MIYFTL
jgi:zinc D-Ala-D-Ala carboxypeptidase